MVDVCDCIQRHVEMLFTGRCGNVCICSGYVCMFMCTSEQGYMLFSVCVCVCVYIYVCVCVCVCVCVETLYMVDLCDCIQRHVEMFFTGRCGNVFCRVKTRTIYLKITLCFFCYLL